MSSYLLKKDWEKLIDFIFKNYWTAAELNGV